MPNGFTLDHSHIYECIQPTALAARGLQRLYDQMFLNAVYDWPANHDPFESLAYESWGLPARDASQRNGRCTMELRRGVRIYDGVDDKYGFHEHLSDGLQGFTSR